MSKLSSPKTSFRAASEPRASKLRSRVTNGSRSFVEGDGKSVWARRHRDLVELHAADLGGPALLSEAQVSLCRRAATLEVQLEALEGQLSLGEEINIDVYSRVVGHLRRVLETLGIERRSKDVTPSLSEYLASKRTPPILEAAE